MSEFQFATYRASISLSMFDVELEWKAALWHELNRFNGISSVPFFQFVDPDQLGPHDSKFFMFQCSVDEAMATCERIFDLTNRGWHGVVVGKPDLQQLRLCFQSAGAVATVTSIFELTKVAKIVLRQYLNQPIQLRDWKTEVFQRIPWRDAFSGD